MTERISTMRLQAEAVLYRELNVTFMKHEKCLLFKNKQKKFL